MFDRFSIALCCTLLLSGLAIAAGPYPEEVMQWTDAQKQTQRDAGEKLLVDLQRAIEQKQPVFNIPKGQYRFAHATDPNRPNQPTHVRFDNAHHLTVEGNSSTFWFENQATGLFFVHSDQVTVRNLFMDWDPLPFTQGTVVSVDTTNNDCVVRIDSGYERVTDDFRRWNRKTGNLRGAFFDAATGNIKPRQIGFRNEPFWENKVADHTYRVRIRTYYGANLGMIGAQPGDRIALWMRKGRAVRIETCGQVTMENVTLFASPFVAFVEAGGSGPNVYRHCQIIKRPDTNRLIAGNADGFNSNVMEHGPVIENSRIDTIGDDFVNIHGQYYRVLSQDDPSSVAVQRIAYRNELVPQVTLLFYRDKTWEFLGSRTAVTQQLTKVTLDPATALATPDMKWASGAQAIAYGKPLRAHRFTLDRPLKLDGPTIVACESYVGRGAVVRNCHFTGSLAIGIRLQSPNAVITDNVLRWIIGHAMTFCGYPKFWGEGVDAHDVLVRNNQFIDTCLDKTSQPVAIWMRSPLTTDPQHAIRKIRFIGNTLTRPGGSGMLVSGAADSQIIDNTISQYGNFPPVPRIVTRQHIDGLQVGDGIQIFSSQNITLQNNTFTEPGPYAKDQVNRQLPQ